MKEITLTEDLYRKLSLATGYGQPISEDDIAEGLASKDPHMIWHAIKASGIKKNSRYFDKIADLARSCLLYTSPSPRDQRGSRMPSSA